jgi:hypothetical protein
MPHGPEGSFPLLRKGRGKRKEDSTEPQDEGLLAQAFVPPSRTLAVSNWGCLLRDYFWDAHTHIQALFVCGTEV